jgi:hypothetical protein
MLCGVIGFFFLLMITFALFFYKDAFIIKTLSRDFIKYTPSKLLPLVVLIEESKLLEPSKRREGLRADRK